MQESPDPTRRFADRVDDYVRFRPGYPQEVMDFLVRELPLAATDVVADIGSGTGKLTRMFLEHGNVVHAVEPNREMRRAAESLLREFPGVRSVAGSAEATTLEDDSVDVIVAAQAFHWFRPEPTRREWCRVLRGSRRLALIWNRRLEGSPFLRGYEELLQRHSLDYSKVDHRRVTDSETLTAFFGGAGPASTRFPNAQELDRTGLEGRARSSSYVPVPGQPGHAALFGGLRRLFDLHQRKGTVRIEYETELFWGHLG